MWCPTISIAWPLHPTSLWIFDVNFPQRSSYTFPKQLESDQPERGSLTAEASSNWQLDTFQVMTMPHNAEVWTIESLSLGLISLLAACLARTTSPLSMERLGWCRCKIWEIDWIITSIHSELRVADFACRQYVKWWYRCSIETTWKTWNIIKLIDRSTDGQRHTLQAVRLELLHWVCYRC